MRYELVVKALWASDPEFVALSKALYGPSATVENVIKNKTADDYEHSRKRSTQTAIGGGVIAGFGANQMRRARDTAFKAKVRVNENRLTSLNKPGRPALKYSGGVIGRKIGHQGREIVRLVTGSPDPVHAGERARSVTRSAHKTIENAGIKHAKGKNVMLAGAGFAAVGGAGAAYNARKRDKVTKMGPDASSVHVPGNNRPKKLRRIDERVPVNKAGSGIPHRERAYVRSDDGRFSSAMSSLASGATSGVLGAGSAVAGVATANKAKNLSSLLERAKRAPGGRKAILGALAASGASTAGYGLLTGATAGLSARQGVKTYENLAERAGLEREHKGDVKEASRRMDSEFFYDGAETPRTVTTDRGKQKSATTRILSKVPKKSNAKFTRPMDDLVREKTADDYDDSDPKDDDEVGKSEAFTVRGDLTEVDQDARQVFGWANVTHVNNLPVGDHQGDVIPEIAELEKAAYHYVLNSRIGGGMHWRVDDDGRLIAKNKPHHVSDMIESVVFTPEKIEKMGISSDKVGWWVGFQVNDDAAWAKVKDGTWSGFSIHGAGKRTPLGDDYQIYDAQIGKSVDRYGDSDDEGDEIPVPKLRERARDWDTDALVAGGIGGVGGGGMAIRSGTRTQREATKLLRSKAKTAPKGAARMGQEARRVFGGAAKHGGRTAIGVGGLTLAAGGYGAAAQRAPERRRRY